MDKSSAKSLYDQVLHLIEGEEIIKKTHQLPDGTTRTTEWKAPTTDSWIRVAETKGILTPVQFLAIVHFVLCDWSAGREAEEEIVSQWRAALMCALETGEIIARNKNSLLKLPAMPTDLDWVLFTVEADAYVSSKGMQWTCTEIVKHLFDEAFPIDAVVRDETSAPKPSPAKQRTAAQDEAILTAIKNAGYDPVALPIRSPGKAGVKADIRKTLSKNPLFVGAKIFDKAWDRLRGRGDLVDQI
jgi:hypothetical protein